MLLTLQCVELRHGGGNVADERYVQGLTDGLVSRPEVGLRFHGVATQIYTVAIKLDGLL